MQTVSDTDSTTDLELRRARVLEIFDNSRQQIYKRTDRMFARLMVAQWLAGIAAALLISPKTWIGSVGQVHWHVWAAILLGGLIAVFPVFLAFRRPGQKLTRHVIAVAQMFTSSLLIHLTGGRIETHFHVFGSLAFLAFYRDWRVLITATVVVAVDHLTRGLFWPQSVFGVLTASSWRWLEHAGWVLFEDTFLILSIRQGLREMFSVAEQRVGLEAANSEIERKVKKRTAELSNAHYELQFREERYRKLSDSSPIGIFETNAAGEVLYTNPCWQDIAGLTFEASLKEGWQQAIHPDDSARVFREWGACALEGREFDTEFRFLRPSGEERWVHARSVVIRNESDQVTGHVGTTEDITERRLAQRRLAENEHRLRSILDAEPECVKLVAADGSLLDMNPAGLKIIDADSLEQVTGKSCFNLIAPEYLPAFRSLNDAVFQGESRIVEFEIIGLKGAHRWLESHACPLRDADGKIIAHLAVSRDITARKESEIKLARAQNELIETSRLAGMAEVATGVLHNVGNVLNSVNVASHCIADNLRKSKASNLSKVVTLLREHELDLGHFFATDAKGKQVPAYLAQLAEHMASEQSLALGELEELQKHIDHIKDIVAMQQSFAKVSGLTEVVNVADLVEDALHMNESALARHDVKVIKEFGDVPPVTVEKHKVLQILVNLVRNAKQACNAANRDDKRITLRVNRGEDRIIITVADNGVGIPPENLSRIFAHGFTTKKNGHGFGLHSGALAAKEIGGVLSVQSDGVGRGTVFTLELPLNSMRLNHA